ncbi:MAG: chromosomal replication initiator protein DnaA [Terriglobales bacterium]
MASSSAKPQTTWDAILGEIQKEVNPHSFETWLRPTRQEQHCDGMLVIAVPNPDFTRVQQKFGPQIERAVGRLNLQDAVQNIRFVAPPPAAPAAPPPPLKQARLDFESMDHLLNPRYTFDTFVVGASNQFAHAAAQATSERPGKAYNPLFLYGGVGMGKTHLMHAIGQRSRSLFADLRIEYLSAEKFTNEMISALRNDQMVAFRDRYRTIDLLLIDDIQFIANKERTQEEFFHTFNALYGAQKQIVLSSDRPPRELSQLEERLRSRFEVGLIADIQAPDLETKISILIQRAQMERLVHPNTPELTPEVAEFIAGAIKSNIRELEGALVRLLAYCALKGVPIGIPIAQEALRNVIDQQQRKLDIETIARAVAEHFGMRIADLKARNNSKNIVFPRQLGMFLAKQLTEASLGEIARFYGGKHHSTVIHSIRKIEQERQADRELDRTLNRLTEQLG